MRPPNRVYVAALEVQRFCDERDWPACIIGGLAVLRWGELRTTRDVDFTLFTGLGGEAGFVNELLSCFPSRIEDPLSFALANRMVLITASNGITADIGLGGFPFEERIIERSSRFAFLPDVMLATCSAEDLIVLKAIAGRGRDWSDIEGVAVVQREHLDWAYINEVLSSLSEVFDSDGALDQLAQIRRIAEEE